MKLTKEQIAIVEFKSGTALVDAGPGCGKSTTLVNRGLSLLTDSGVTSKQLLFLTFGTTLAGEITSLPQRAGTLKDAKVQTFHAFSLKLITEHHALLGLPEPPTKVRTTIFLQLAKKVAREHDVEFNSLLRHAFLSPLQEGKSLTRTMRRAIADLEKRYMQKASKGYIDFQGMIRLAVRLLEENPGLLRGQYTHLLVDELQDLDEAETELLILLANSMDSAVLVGDPNQRIYSFRGADEKNWLRVIQQLNPSRFELTKTFRCPDNSLALANRIRTELSPNSTTLKGKRQGSRVRLVKLSSLADQIEYLSSKIGVLLEAGTPADKIACLARHKQEASSMAMALKAAGINMITRYHVPKNYRHLDMFWAMVELTRMEKERQRRRKKAFIRDEGQRIEKLIDEDFLFPKKVRKELIQRFKKKRDKSILSVRSKSEAYTAVNRLNKAIFEATKSPLESAIQKFIDALSPLIRKKYKKSREYYLQDFIEIKIAARACNSIEQMSCVNFANAAYLKGVVISTIHGAKGQEWDYVFVLNSVDGIIPSFTTYGDRVKVESEKRLFYVAVTRHKEKLYILETPTPRTQYRPSKSGKRNKAYPRMLENRTPFIRSGDGLKKISY